MYSKSILLSAAAIVLCSGCVTGRRMVPLNPASPSGPEPAQVTRTFVLTEVADGRQFENSPPAPNTPSIMGDVGTLTPEMKSHAIGRQRNTYGKAMGDVFLPNDQTVEQHMQKMVVQAFAANGVRLATTAEPGATAEVSVEIVQFWGWMTPGFWSIPFEAEVGARLNITVNGTTSTITAMASGRNQAQVASDANWQVTYDRAFEEFQKTLAARIREWLASQPAPTT